MDAQEDEESRMYCNISHADMRQGKTRLVMSSRVKGRIAQFCAKNGISGKSLPDGAACVALMKHIGFFTVDSSVFCNVTHKVLTWIQSNIIQAKMAGILKEESTSTEGSRRKDWKIQYTVSAIRWIDDDYNPFQSGFGQTEDVQFAPPFLRQSRSLDAAVNAAVDAVVDEAGETSTANAVVRRTGQPERRISQPERRTSQPERRTSQPEDNDIVMDELYDLDELTVSGSRLLTPSAPPTATAPPWSPVETPFHRAVAHMMVIAHDSTMEQVQMYLNSEQGIKDAISRLFKEDRRTLVEPGSEELVQTREHANALAIENRDLQQRIRDLEHKVSILADITNQSEYIALECRLRNMEKELQLVRKDATFENEKLAEELRAAQVALVSRPRDHTKSAEYLALQQRCQSLEQELATLQSNFMLAKDKSSAQLASAQQELRDPTKTAAYLTVQRQLEMSEMTLEVAREDARRQRRTIQDLQTQLAALQSASFAAGPQDSDSMTRQLVSPMSDEITQADPQAEKQCSPSNEDLRGERDMSDKAPGLTSEGSFQAMEDRLRLITTNAHADEQPSFQASFEDYIRMKQQEPVVSKYHFGENGSKEHVNRADGEGVLGRNTELVLDGCDIIDSTTNGHLSTLGPGDSTVPVVSSQAPAAPAGASIHAAATPTTNLVEKHSLVTSDLPLRSPSSHSHRGLDSTSTDSSAPVPLPIRIQKPVRPSWM